MACDTRLKLERIPLSLQQVLELAETAEAVFSRLEPGPHHDGLKFENGVEITLQRLGPGVSAYMLDELAIPRESGRAREMAEVG
jgi:hypothetical protein